MLLFTQMLYICLYVLISRDFFAPQKTCTKIVTVTFVSYHSMIQQPEALALK